MADKARLLRLTGLIGSRMCHDLVSPLGAIGNGVELLEMSPDFPGIARSQEMTLIGESIGAARERVQLFRTAFGHAGPEQRIGSSELSALTRALSAGGKLRISVETQGDLPRAEARLILLALMCLETALPWGGRVMVVRSDDGWRLVAEAQRTRADPELWSWLDGLADGRPDPAPSEVQFALLPLLAAQMGRAIRWELDGLGGEIAF